MVRPSSSLFPTQCDADRAMTNVIELFTHMDLAQLSALVDTEVLSSLGLPPFNDSRHSSLPDVSEGTRSFLASI